MASTSSSQRLGIAALILAVGVLLSRLLGYVREAVIAYQVGAGPQTDAYNAAFTLPDMMNYFLAGGTLSITFIPLFSAHLARNQEREGWHLLSTIITITGGLMSLAIIAAMVWTEPLVGLLSPGFDAPTLALTVRMTRLILPAQLCFYVGSLIAATEMARGRFTAVALAPLLYNSVIIIAGLVLGAQMGMEAFALGALLGAIAGPLCFNLWGARRSLRLHFSLDWRLASFHRFLWLSLPLMLGVSLVTVDEWIARYIGSGLDPGNISWFNYARRLMMAPIAVIGQATAQAALPFMSKLAAENQRDRLAGLLTQTLSPLLLVAALAAGLCLVLAEPLTALVYQRGAFSAEDTRATAAALRLFAVGVIAWGVQTLSARAFYAEQRMWSPMIVSTCVTLASLPLFDWMGHRWGASGLAMASTIGISVQASVTLWIYSIINPAIDLPRISVSLLRCAGLAACAAASAWGVARALDGLSLALHVKALLTLGCAGGAGVLTLAVLASAIRAPEWVPLQSALLRRLHRRGSP